MVSKRIGSSIFLKVFLTVFFTTVLLKVIFFAGLKLIMKPHIENSVKTMFVGYADLLFEEVGPTFDSTVARAIAEKSGMIVVYRDSQTGKEWSSSPSTHYFPREGNRFYVVHEDERFGFRIGRVHARVFRDSGEYLLVTNMKNAIVQLAWIQILTPFLGILIVAAISFWLLREILKPIKSFMVGVDRFGEGNFSYRIETDRHDEFGTLANSFNSMGSKLSNMVEEKEQLIRDISHEMKTPITRSTMALEFLPDSDFKERIANDLRELNRMITEILETERLESNYGGLSLEKVSLNRLIEQIISEYEFKSPIPISFTPKEGITLQADPERLRLVFSNIIGNALKYSHKGGKPVEVETAEVDKRCIITIKDHGIGIEKCALDRIFEPFYRVDKHRTKEVGGYGLGLHLCKKIIKAHEGEISVRSTPGEGTTVFITVPKEKKREI